MSQILLEFCLVKKDSSTYMDMWIYIVHQIFLRSFLAHQS